MSKFRYGEQFPHYDSEATSPFTYLTRFIVGFIIIVVLVSSCL